MLCFFKTCWMKALHSGNLFLMDAFTFGLPEAERLTKVFFCQWICLSWIINHRRSLLIKSLQDWQTNRHWVRLFRSKKLEIWLTMWFSPGFSRISSMIPWLSSSMFCFEMLFGSVTTNKRQVKKVLPNHVPKSYQKPPIVKSGQWIQFIVAKEILQFHSK